MGTLAVASSWFVWHYLFAWTNITRVFMNLTWFSWRLFSVPELFLNLFSPFERLDEKPKNNMPNEIGSAILVSLIMRVMGAIIRIPIIVLGLLSTLFVLIIWVVAYVVWFVLPFLAIGSIVFGCLKIFGLI
jgi:hypothetical protein